MASEENLINFDIIETQKENIQSLPQGRSAKALAAAFSPTPFSPIPTPGSTRNLNDAIRAEYEKELLDIGDSDDPLDIYDRYVKWTLNAYPSAQATPESQLRQLLERATKAFQSSSHYKNDPRYLRLWMHYIRFFSDAPREAFAYLARHNIGEGLALFYEEFASWLEGAGRWAQAEEIYKLGLEREARPTERLLRKFGEFQQRLEQRPQASEGPSSPALPTVRPALAAKIDPFASTPRAQDPQAQTLPSNAPSTRGSRQKLAIFSDADGPDSASIPSNGDNTKGWQNIGTIDERRKENVIGAKPWVGETLKSGKKSGAVSKMTIFRDETNPQSSEILSNQPSMSSQRHNPRTGKIERVFVNLDAVYPHPENIDQEEYSFEELRAKHRGWLDKTWTKPEPASEIPTESQVTNDQNSSLLVDNQENESGNFSGGDQTLSELTLGGSLRPRKSRTSRQKQKKFVEVKSETQTVQLNLGSPTGRKIRRKSTREPTMTLHTKAATDDILDIFNQPLRSDMLNADTESVGEAEDDDDDEEDYTGYTSVGDSTDTGVISAPASDFGDDETGTREDITQDATDPQSTSPWSDFTLSKHKPNLDDYDFCNLDETHDRTNSQNGEQTSLSTNLDLTTEPDPVQPVAETLGHVKLVDVQEQEEPHTKLIAISPEDYEAPTHPYRDAGQMAQNRLPFMTPIVEQTESSIPSVKVQKEHFNAKTPSRKRDEQNITISEMEDLLIASPLQVALNVMKPDQGNLVNVSKALIPPKPKPSRTTGAIIKDKQCNPVDENIRKTILENIQPPLKSFEGYFDCSSVSLNKGAEIRKYIKTLTKNRADKTSNTALISPTLTFPSSTSIEYTIKRELGKGAFAPVYLASASTTQCSPDPSSPPPPPNGAQSLVAIKAEHPPNPWEFYVLRIAHQRLLGNPATPAHSRAARSLASASAFHLFSDEAYLLESYHDQGTLLDLANLARADAASAGGAQGQACDECVAMFFAAELLRTLEALHAAGVLHGDVKADNCLVRLEALSSSSSETAGGETGWWDPAYRADGSGGWASKGLALIDFGRGVDVAAFEPGVQFIADWKTSRLDCPEMRELRPWTFQADYWGAAGVLHVLLFGKWIEDVEEKAPAAAAAAATAKGDDGDDKDDGMQTTSAIVGSRTKRYRLKEGFKRYWQADIWAAVFDLLMNPSAWADAEPARRLPVTGRVAAVRRMLERWLEENAERRGLKAQLRKLEERLRAAKGGPQAR